MNKIDIFNEIIRIMGQDSSTIKDIKGPDVTVFEKQITENMTEEAFVYVVKSYLASFGIIAHVFFGTKNEPIKGFRLRKNKDRLFVTDAVASTHLVTGDEIIAINGRTIDTIYEQNKDFFVSEKEERQYLEWEYLVKHAQNITVKRDNDIKNSDIGIVSETEVIAPRFEGTFIAKGLYYLKLEDFNHEREIQAVYHQLEESLPQIDNLVIDVRVNHGGSDSLYIPLLPYLLEAGAAYPADDAYGMEILYTENNVDRRLKDFDDYLNSSFVTAETQAMLQEMAHDLKINKGKGFVPYRADNSFFNGIIGKESNLKHVYVLCDVTCGSSGDNFVEMVKKLPKVTVVGRPTLGVLDYSNCITIDFGDYYFVYPTSRSLTVDVGKGMNDCGVVPEILIEWTPEHLIKDVDLEQVISFIQ